MDLIQAVRELREHLSESQQAFATRLGISIRALANYEKDRAPTGAALISLIREARSQGLEEHANTFVLALVKELKIRPGDFFMSMERPEGGQHRGFLLWGFSGPEETTLAHEIFKAVARRSKR